MGMRSFVKVAMSSSTSSCREASWKPGGRAERRTCGLGPAGGAGFAEDADQVSCLGVNLDEQFLSDLAIAFTGGHGPQHLHF